MKKDKRSKGCPNEACIRYKKYRYKAEEQYCSICGEPLVFVCANCFNRIEDQGLTHRYCVLCEQDKARRQANAKKKVVAVGAAAGTVVVGSAKVAKDVLKKAPEMINAVKKLK